MFILAIAIAAVAHILIIRWLIRRVVGWHVPRWLLVTVVFAFFGAVLGTITMAISNDFARDFINPFGAPVADYLHNSWYPQLSRPDNWESIMPWAMRSPQAYPLITMAIYACIGVTLTFGSIFGGEQYKNFVGIEIGQNFPDGSDGPG